MQAGQIAVAHTEVIQRNAYAHRAHCGQRDGGQRARHHRVFRALQAQGLGVNTVQGAGVAQHLQEHRVLEIAR
ncbi:hypothetical protein D3C85_1710940 [compost metagenome]